MNLTSRFTFLLSFLTMLIVSGCGVARPDGPPPAEPHEVAQLAQEIRALGPEVDSAEADRAARVTYDYTYQLSREYQITDPPLIHNTKVNLGLRPRGVCWHWAHDIEERLKQENFRTLDLHRAVANSDNIRLEHSTAIISRRGDAFDQGIILDPWRKGGVLFWSPVLADSRYKWRPRDEVLAERGVHVPTRAQILPES